METFNNVYAPYIGVNGNWYVNNEDTGVKAQGPKGEEGPVGGCGAQGLRGLKGETGDRGPQGLKGDTPELAADLQTTVSGKALDATQGKVLDDKISVNTDSINTINNILSKKYVSHQVSVNAHDYGSLTLDCGGKANAVVGYNTVGADLALTSLYVNSSGNIYVAYNNLTNNAVTRMITVHYL